MCMAFVWPQECLAVGHAARPAELRHAVCNACVCMYERDGD